MSRDPGRRRTGIRKPNDVVTDDRRAEGPQDPDPRRAVGAGSRQDALRDLPALQVEPGRHGPPPGPVLAELPARMDADRMA
jgi:hypothetical protein